MELVTYIILFVSALLNIIVIRELVIDKNLIDEKSKNEESLKIKLLKANEQLSELPKKESNLNMKEKNLLDKEKDLAIREKALQRKSDEVETLIRREVEKRVSDKFKSLDDEISTLERERGNLVREIKKLEQKLSDLTKEIEDALQKKKDILITISTLKLELSEYRQPQIHIEAGGDIIFPKGIKRVEIDSSEYTDSRRCIEVTQYSDSRSCRYSNSSRNLSVLDQSDKSRHQLQETNKAEFLQRNQLRFYPFSEGGTPSTSNSSSLSSLYERSPPLLPLSESSSPLSLPLHGNISSAPTLGSRKKSSREEQDSLEKESYLRIRSKKK